MLFLYGQEVRRSGIYKPKLGRAYCTRRNGGGMITLREVAKWKHRESQERERINNGQTEQREIIEAGGQFDFVLRKMERAGLDFRAEW